MFHLFFQFLILLILFLLFLVFSVLLFYFFFFLFIFFISFLDILIISILSICVSRFYISCEFSIPFGFSSFIYVEKKAFYNNLNILWFEIGPALSIYHYFLYSVLFFLILIDVCDLFLWDYKCNIATYAHDNTPYTSKTSRY